ncbi:hypothetical protein GOP47_0010573 [Adiantum capillus-veneris]|uniref:Uncharacterized protein n=1 Tax=Adiantum capillus-veneris TaxID=13818 RepID=A0A9D4UVJ7_ADICA|nr:hypothetical protein GOP47_0010573 [Adiantum capillus-veneris]
MRPQAAFKGLSNSLGRCEGLLNAAPSIAIDEQGQTRNGRARMRQLRMLNRAVQTALRATAKVLSQRLSSSCRVTRAANLATLSLCRQWDSGRLKHGHMLRDARQFCSRNATSDSENDAGEPHSDAPGNSDDEEISHDGNSDEMYSDHDIFEAFHSELAAGHGKDDDDGDSEAEASDRATQSDHKSKKEEPDDEHEWRPGKPWHTTERTKACLARLKKGPDGRFINVLEVATEVDMLLASFLRLRKKDDPDAPDNSDEDERYLEGVDIKKFKRLQKRARAGTYKVQPAVYLPLKRKVVRLKKKKVKKRHAF